MTREEMGHRVWEHRVPMLRLAMTVVRSPQDAEDAVSEAVVKAMNGAESLRDEARIKPWLLTITARCCQDILRRRKREQPTDDASVFHRPVFVHRPEDGLWELIRTLPPSQAQVLTLYYYDGLTSAQIARVLSLSLSAVLMRMKRGRQRLKALYEMEGRCAP